MDPDEQVQETIRLVFRLFDRLTTAYAVMCFLANHGILLPKRQYGGPDKGELVWRRAGRDAVLRILRNPAYAGAYAYGRRRLDPARLVPGQPASGRVEMPLEEWDVLLPDVLPAYITFDDYQRNLARIADNRHTKDSIGSPRAGPALLAGLVKCGRCGYRATIQYPSWTICHASPHSYSCGAQTSAFAGAYCQSVAGDLLDAHVSEQVLAALTPAALELSLHAAGQLQDERVTQDRLWRLRIERAEHTADHARRAFHLVEPENRLVARQLEGDWEHALTDLAALREDYDRFTATLPIGLSDSEHTRIRALADNIPALWHAPATTDIHRKRIIRAVLTSVEFTVIGVSERVLITTTWAGGHHSRTEITRPVGATEQLSYYPQLVTRITEMTNEGLGALRIAHRLNAEGLHPPRLRGGQWQTSTLQAVISRLGLVNTHARNHGNRTPGHVLSEHQWRPSDLARELGMSRNLFNQWIRREWITAHREPGPAKRWIVTADPAEVDRLRQLRALPRGLRQRHLYLQQQNAPQATEGHHNGTTATG
ncbi:recombinase family protein [Streptomyces olivoreticuli]